MTWEGYALSIETNCYAGNFEREMCAFVTGQIGDCGVGDKEASKFETEFPEWDIIFEEKVQQVQDEGCYRPVACQGGGSLEIYFWDDPTKEELQFLRERILKFKYNGCDVHRGKEYDEPESKYVDLIIYNIKLIEQSVSVTRKIWAIESFNKTK